VIPATGAVGSGALEQASEVKAGVGEAERRSVVSAAQVIVGDLGGLLSDPEDGAVVVHRLWSAVRNQVCNEVCKAITHLEGCQPPQALGFRCSPSPTTRPPRVETGVVCG
jgi:hypothetical protein